jgi:hypothetical protein
MFFSRCVGLFHTAAVFVIAFFSIDIYYYLVLIIGAVLPFQAPLLDSAFCRGKKEQAFFLFFPKEW